MISSTVPATGRTTFGCPVHHPVLVAEAPPGQARIVGGEAVPVAFEAERQLGAVSNRFSPWRRTRPLDMVGIDSMGSTDQ
jgi:hypothetical protein